MSFNDESLYYRQIVRTVSARRDFLALARRVVENVVIGGKALAGAKHIP